MPRTILSGLNTAGIADLQAYHACSHSTIISDYYLSLVIITIIIIIMLLLLFLGNQRVLDI